MEWDIEYAYNDSAHLTSDCYTSNFAVDFISHIALIPLSHNKDIDTKSIIDPILVSLFVYSLLQQKQGYCGVHVNKELAQLTDGYVHKLNSLEQLDSQKREQQQSSWINKIWQIAEERINWQAMEQYTNVVQYVGTNAAMSFIYFSLGKMVSLKLTPLADNPFAYYSANTAASIMINTFVNPKTIYNSGMALVNQNLNDFMAEMPKLADFSGEAVEEFVDQTLKATNGNNAPIFHVSNKVISKAMKLQYKQQRLADSDEECVLLNKAMQNTVCNKWLMKPFRENIIFSLGLPYCRDSVNFMMQGVCNFISDQEAGLPVSVVSDEIIVPIQAPYAMRDEVMYASLYNQSVREVIETSKLITRDAHKIGNYIHVLVS